ncbi:MAG: alkaline phosphatase family protein [Candidatus Aminicenantaceae bacterium]
MKFLRVLTNSIIIGIVFSMLLSILILDININLDFHFTVFSHLIIFNSITYGILISLICITIFYMVQYFYGRRIKIFFVSPSFLSISTSITIILFILISNANYKYFHSFLSPKKLSLIRTQANYLIFLSIMGAVLFFTFLYYKKNIIFILIFFGLFAGCMSYIIVKRIETPISVETEKVANLEAKNINKKVTIIGLEGLSFDFIIPMINEGKLPNFSWLIEQGSWGKLNSFSPSEPIVLNNSFNTGKLPANHKQISQFNYNLLNFKDRIEVTPRFILYHQMTRAGLIKISSKEAVLEQKDIWEILKDNKTEFLKKDWPYDLNVNQPDKEAEKLFDTLFQELRYDKSRIVNPVKQAIYRDYTYEKNVRTIKNKTNPQLVYFFLNGLSTVETYFYKYNFPKLFEGLEQEEINKYSPVIENYYRYYDQIIGRYLASLKDDELLIVFSPYGIEPLSIWRRLIQRIMGNADATASHEHAPPGVVFFYGNEVVKGKNIESINIIDMAPTILYYIGLPVGKDMDGIAQRSILFTEEFINENPIFLIQSYEQINIKKP